MSRPVPSLMTPKVGTYYAVADLLLPMFTKPTEFGLINYREWKHQTIKENFKMLSTDK